MNTQTIPHLSPPSRLNAARRGARLLGACALFVAAHSFAQDPFILVGTNNYSAYRTDLAAGAWVYVDADSAGATPVRAMQRALGYREVDYKSVVPGTLYFSAVAPTTNGATVTYDYTTQLNKATNLVGFWVDKDAPVIIGPDGNPYITDGHHTTAGYLSPLSPVRQVVPGKNRVIFGHIVANYFDAMAGPQPVTDAWWTARAAENNALLYGPDGDQLILPGEPNFSGLQSILPSVLAMPTTPSNLTTNGATAMSRSIYRGLAWGLADAIVLSATNSAGVKIAGFKKKAPGSLVDINFVEFFWADYLRHRVVWDDTLSGSPFGSTNGDANVTAAPLSFFAATANGTALARSEAYRDEFGRNIVDYTNALVFSPTAVSWARGSISNGLAGAADIYHLFLRDDSTIIGAIQPSALSTNTLHIDTVAGMTVTQTLQNIRTIIVNAGGLLKISWKDTTVSNTTLRLPAGTGAVTVTGTNFVATNTILGGGILAVEGTLRGSLQVTNGVLQGNGAVNGAVTVSGSGTLSPGASIGTLTVKGALTLGATTLMEANKSGAALTKDLVNGISTLTYGGTLTLLATGDSLVAGDAFKLFDAASYSGAFATLDLPALDAGLSWDTTRLLAEGTLAVVAGTTAPTLAAQPATQTRNAGLTVTLTGGAVGTVPIAYQWQFNGGDLAGKTNSTLLLSNLQEANQGSYRFIATNSAGWMTSAPAILTVNQLPVTANDQLGATSNQAATITVATLLVNDSDADGDTLTVTAVSSTSTNGGAVSLSGGVVTYTPKLNFVGQDRFTYTVNDGAGSTASGAVVVTVTLPNTLSPNHVTIAITTNGHLIRYLGIASRNYVVQQAAEVSGLWSDLSPAIAANAAGLVEFEDTNAPLPAVRFYRTHLVP